MIPSLEIIEISALAGYNAVLIDMEHGPYSFSEVRTSVSVAQGSRIKAFVRPASKSSRDLLSCLETGADGLMIPHVSTRAEMEAIVNSVFYSPIGNRGASGFTRATRYGDIPFHQHRKNANDNIFIGVLIESKEGLNNIEEIVSVGHVDCIYFGTYDIAVSMGLDNQMDMRVQNAVKNALDITEGKVNYYGQVSVSKEQRQSLDDRINFIAHGVDCGIALESIWRLVIVIHIQMDIMGSFSFVHQKHFNFLKDESEKKLAIILNEKDVRVEMIDALLDPCQGIVTMVRMAIDPVNFKRALELAEAIKDKGFEVAFNVTYMSTWDNHPEFNYLIEKSFAVITDSGGITEETTVMGVPCLTLRENTERPETISVGTNELIGTNPKNIGPAMKTLFSGEWKTGGIPELWDGKSAKRIVNVIQNLRLSI